MSVPPELSINKYYSSFSEESDGSLYMEEEKMNRLEEINIYDKHSIKHGILNIKKIRDSNNKVLLHTYSNNILLNKSNCGGDEESNREVENSIK